MPSTVAMGVVRKILTGIALALVTRHVCIVIYMMSFHKAVYNHSPGPCHLVPGVEEGSEDIYTLSDGIALITTGIKWGPSLHNKYNKRKGRLLMFDFNNVEAGVEEIKLEGVKIDNPHGIGVWEDADQAIVFVVDHSGGKESIIQLEFERDRKIMKHIRTINDPLFRDLNDVVPTSPNSFYVTNLRGTSYSFLQTLEMYLLLKWGFVVHYDGTKVKIAAEGIISPNGINMSPDGKYVYIASPLTHTLLVYKRLFDNRLELHQTVPLYTAPDNIDVEKSTGDLWIGCQPVMHTVIQHFEDTTIKSPSQVLRLKMEDGNVSYMEEVYSEDGRHISATTIANHYKGAMLAGSIMHKLLYCKVNHLE